MVADTVLLSHTKKPKKTAHGHICMVSKGTGGPKTIHDENNVLTDDELIVARDSLRNSKYACLYIYTKRISSWILY